MRDKDGIDLGQLLLYSAVAALGGLLFGFDIAIITGAGPLLTADFQLNSVQEGWAYSSLLFGCIAGAAVTGRMTDLWGRRLILFVVAFLFAFTSVLSAISMNLTFLVIARLMGGLAVGSASVVAPLFISEISPAKYRGSLVSMYQLFITTGILISYLINYLLLDSGENNWRWMFATGVIPSILFFILLFFVSESPRFLYLKGEKDKAFFVLKRIGGEQLAKGEYEEIEKSITGKPVNYKMLFEPSLRKVLWVGFGLAFLIHFSGMSTIIDYAPKIFSTAGWKLDTGLFATIGIGIVNFVFTWVSIIIIDKFGRRPLYIIGSAGLFFTLIGLSIAGFAGHFSGIIVLSLVVLFVMLFASCIGPVFWTYISEIFPNNVRGTAMTIPVLTQWLCNAIIVLLFPSMMHHLDTGITFGMFSLFALGQLVFAFVYMRETKGKSLEEIEMIWKEK